MGDIYYLTAKKRLENEAYREDNIVLIFAYIYQYLEGINNLKDYPRIRLLRNWLVHTKLDKHPEIIKGLNRAFHLYDSGVKSQYPNLSVEKFLLTDLKVELIRLFPEIELKDAFFLKTFKILSNKRIAGNRSTCEYLEQEHRDSYFVSELVILQVKRTTEDYNKGDLIYQCIIKPKGVNLQGLFIPNRREVALQ